ncbi:MAG: hypothetical protein ACYTBP_09640 [Planctomycetota bacterium]
MFLRWDFTVSVEMNNFSAISLFGRRSSGRMSEINRLTWDDVNFKQQYVILHTRKKKGGHLTPRKLSHRFSHSVSNTNKKAQADRLSL